MVGSAKTPDWSDPFELAAEDVRVSTIASLQLAMDRMSPSLGVMDRFEAEVAGLAAALCCLIIASVPPDDRPVVLSAIQADLPKVLDYAGTLDTYKVQ